MRPIGFFSVLLLSLVLAACSPSEPPGDVETAEDGGSGAPPRSDGLVAADPDGFVYETERFADVRILRYRVPGFE